MSAVTVGELMSHLGEQRVFRMVAGGVRALGRMIAEPTVQRVGVALTGHTEHLVPGRLQMIGRSETAYLERAPEDICAARLRALVAVNFPGLVVTADQTPPDALAALCDEAGIALMCTGLESIEATVRIQEALARWLSPRESRHAVLVDVFGVGMLLVGKSGIGKSELGLELVARGHRLVADDLVLLQQQGDRVVGHSPELTRHHMEIRGLGIINIKDLFGAAAVVDQTHVDLVAELVDWRTDGDYERLGLSTRHMELAEVPVEHVTLPVRPGRSLSLIIEVAARNRLLQGQGMHSARAFAARLGAHIAESAAREAGFRPAPAAADDDPTAGDDEEPG